jgi:hypothetical protein
MRWSAQNEPGRLLPACAEVASRPQLALRLPAPQFLRITRTAGDHPNRSLADWGHRIVIDVGRFEVANPLALLEPRSTA